MIHSRQPADRFVSIFRTGISLVIGAAFTALVVFTLSGNEQHDLNASEQVNPSPERLSDSVDTVNFQIALLNQNQLNQNQNQQPASSNKRTIKLPDYFTQIGLSGPQVMQVREVQKKHQTEIEKYQSLLEQKKEQRDEELRELLTVDQKRKLRTLQKKASFKRKKKTKSSP